MKHHSADWNANNPDKIRKASRDWRRRNKDAVNAKNKLPHNKQKRRELALKHKYGITLDDYNSMFLKQGGACALCFLPPIGDVLSVDHDHGTGAVRGLLCRRCNIALGMLGDSVEGLERAVRYLKNE